MILSIYYKFIYIHIPKTAGEWLTNKIRKKYSLGFTTYSILGTR